jgi:DNA repair protein RadC
MNEKQFRIVSKETTIERTQIKDSDSCNKYIRQIIKSEQIDINVKEYFYIIALNQSNKTNGFMKVSEGSISSTIVDIRLMAFFLIKSLATSFILFHNHPSGNVEKSDADKTLTKKITEAMKLFDIKITDHLIITSNNFCSFADDGDL